jgi:Putative Flp pilus-assembly TadE/G-like
MHGMSKAAERNDAGSFMVAAAIVLAVLAALAGGLLELGELYVHRHHLQVRTDAATLAAGQALNACFNIPSQFPTEADADAFIENWARNYDGISTSVSTQAGAPYNAHPSTPTDLMWLQSDAYPSSSVQTSKPLGNECFLDNNPANTDPSNVNLSEDVKTTQQSTPFLGFSPFNVHGWARVQLQAIKSLKPTLPLAVPDVNPLHVAVTFVDNSTGNALAGCANGCVFPLCPPAKSKTCPASSGTLNDWSGTATIPVPAADTNVGIRVSIGAQNGSCAGVNATSTYTCYDYSTTGQPSNRGVVVLRSYDNSSSATSTPILRSVTPGSCSGTPYFSMYQGTNGTCSAGLTAVVDFPAGATNQKVFDRITQGNCKNPSDLMSQSGTTWTSSTTSLPTGQGAYDVCLAWSYDDIHGNNHKDDFANPVQQIFSGSDGSDPTLPGGPIMAAMVDTGMTPGYSLTAGSSATVAVTIGLTGGVHVNPRCSAAGGNSGANYVCASDPPVLLRTKVATSNSSLTYTIDCGTVPGHTGGKEYQQFRYGCANSFSVNAADVCPDLSNPSPTDCAPVQTGVATGQVRQALNDRLAPGGVCSKNNYPTTTVENDPRVVLLVDTDFSAFIGSGGSSSSDVPVVTFATFYITGWNGASSNCTSAGNQYGNEPPPSNAGTTDGNIWGHFIDYVTGGGVPSGLKCDLTQFAPCIAALVR